MTRHFRYLSVEEHERLFGPEPSRAGLVFMKFAFFILAIGPFLIQENKFFALWFLYIPLTLVYLEMKAKYKRAAKNKPFVTGIVEFIYDYDAYDINMTTGSVYERVGVKCVHENGRVDERLLKYTEYREFKNYGIEKLS